MKLTEFDRAYARREFEAIRAKVKAGAIRDDIAAFSVALILPALNARRGK